MQIYFGLIFGHNADYIWEGEWGVYILECPPPPLPNGGPLVVSTLIFIVSESTQFISNFIQLHLLSFKPSDLIILPTPEYNR